MGGGYRAEDGYAHRRAAADVILGDGNGHFESHGAIVGGGKVR